MEDRHPAETVIRRVASVACNRGREATRGFCFVVDQSQCLLRLRRPGCKQPGPPARMLGLTQKGHLGPGADADADVTIYRTDPDYQKMFEVPRYVLRAGEIVVEDGEIRTPIDGKLLHVAPGYDEEAVPDIRAWFEQNYTIQFRNYPVDDSYLNEHQVIPTGPR